MHQIAIGKAVPSAAAADAANARFVAELRCARRWLTVVERVDEAALKQGFEELDKLSEEEYRQPLAEVASDADATQSAVRVGRLVGVILKQPFAESVKLRAPSHRTAAYRGWDLLDESAFAARTDSWQYAALDEIRKELVREDPYMRDWSVYTFARDAQNETGFFGFFARAVRRYICGDPEIRSKVEEALKESSKVGNKLPTLTPETIMGSGCPRLLRLGQPASDRRRREALTARGPGRRRSSNVYAHKRLYGAYVQTRWRLVRAPATTFGRVAISRRTWRGRLK